MNGGVPVGIQGNSGHEAHGEHVDVADGDDGQEDLATESGPAKVEEVDVK